MSSVKLFWKIAVCKVDCFSSFRRCKIIFVYNFVTPLISPTFWIKVKVPQQNIADVTSLCLGKTQNCTFFFFFNCYLAVPRPTMDHSQEDSLTNLMLITAFVQVWPKGRWKSHNEVGSLIPANNFFGTFNMIYLKINNVFSSDKILF